MAQLITHNIKKASFFTLAFGYYFRQFCIFCINFLTFGNKSLINAVTVLLFVQFKFTFMEKIILKNGATVLYKKSAQMGVSLTIKVGHLNEPKLGIAAVFERVVGLLAKEQVMSFYGGSMTSFFCGASDDVQLIARIACLYDWCINTPITQKILYRAVADIVLHTSDLAPLPLRQTKLAYKHTAYSKNEVVWDTNFYINSVRSLSVKDLEDYRASCFVGNNMVLVCTGSESAKKQCVEMAEHYFGNLLPGHRHEVDNLLYTGGYQQLNGNGSTNILMLGWDITNIRSRAEANMLMTMLSGRLERSFAESNILATHEVKVAGYYGFNTIRISASCMKRNEFSKVVDIVCANVVRAATQLVSDRRLETTRQRAMTERLLEASKAQPTSVRLAWQFLGRDVMYDAKEWINYVWDVDALDLRDTAREIFASPFTCVVYTDTPSPSYEQIKEKLAF